MPQNSFQPPSFGGNKWRAEFPYLDVNVAGGSVIYLDNGASTQKPRAVIDRMAELVAHEYANIHRGIHELSNRATAAYEAARTRSAKFLNAPQEECIVFTRGTTQLINLVANTWDEAHIEAGDTILFTELEHHSNLIPWQQLAQRKRGRNRSGCRFPDAAGEAEDIRVPAYLEYHGDHHSCGLVLRDGPRRGSCDAHQCGTKRSTHPRGCSADRL